MNAIAPWMIWALAVAVVILAMAMLLHMVVRALSRTHTERQREMDGLVLASLQSGAQADELVLRLQQSNSDLSRRALVHALRSLGEPYFQFVSYVYDRLNLSAHAMRDLRSYRWIRRAEAALELGAFRRPEVLSDGLALLRDPQPEVRMAAARALSDLGSPQAVRALLESIPLATRWAISDMVDLVRVFGEAAGPELLATLSQSPVRQARLAAIEALGEIAHAPAYALILPFLSDPDMEFRVTATRALGRLGGHGVYEALGRAVKDSAWQVRAVAARALGAYRGAEACAILEGALTDAAWWVRLNAADALAQQSTLGAESLRKQLNSPDVFARDIAAQMLQQLQPGGNA